MQQPGCPLCDAEGGALVWQSPWLRVIRAEEAGFPAFYRVVWAAHVAELSDLSGPDRQRCLDAVVAVEQALREHLQPAKINLAALGNMVPHLHWHVVARFGWDTHFPAPVWAAARREAPAALLAEVVARRAALETAMAARLEALPA